MNIDTIPDFKAWAERVLVAKRGLYEISERSDLSPEAILARRDKAIEVVMQAGFINFERILGLLNEAAAGQPAKLNWANERVRRYSILTGGVGLAAYIVQVLIFYLAQSSYNSDTFLECLVERCSPEPLFEPLVWLSVVAMAWGAFTKLAWHSVVVPLAKWLDTGEWPQVTKPELVSAPVTIIQGPAIHTYSGLAIRIVTLPQGGAVLEAYHKGIGWRSAPPKNYTGEFNAGLFFQAQYLRNDEKTFLEYGYTPQELGIDVKF